MFYSGVSMWVQKKSSDACDMISTQKNCEFAAGPGDSGHVPGDSGPRSPEYPAYSPEYPASLAQNTVKQPTHQVKKFKLAQISLEQI